MASRISTFSRNVVSSPSSVEKLGRFDICTRGHYAASNRMDPISHCRNVVSSTKALQKPQNSQVLIIIIIRLEKLSTFIKWYFGRDGLQ